MAITASGLFVATFIDSFDSTQALDLTVETHKGALFPNTITPSFSADPVSYGAGQFVSGINGGTYPSAGVALTGTTLAESVAGSLVFSATDVSVSNTDISLARGYFLYDDAATTPTADMGILLVDFTVDVTTVNGTFQITWTAAGSGGIFNIDLTP